MVYFARSENLLKCSKQRINKIAFTFSENITCLCVEKVSCRRQGWKRGDCSGGHGSGPGSSVSMEERGEGS